VTRPGLQMFPIEQIMELASTLKVELWAFKNNRFEIMDRILSIPRQVADQGKRAQQKILRELRFPKKQNTRRVENPNAKTKRKVV